MRVSILLAVTLLVLPGAVCAADAPLSLSLNEAIRLAVEKNLDVRAEMHNPAQYEADIQRNRSIYDPKLTIESSYTDSSVATGTAGQSLSLNSSLTQMFWTGGTAALTFNNTRSNVSTKTNNWQSGLGASFSQPLLKNMGREATEIAVTLSRTSKFASLDKLNARLLSTVAQVRTEYFKLYSLREERDVKKVSLDLARKILQETQARVNAGVLPAMEVLNAEFGAVTREKELINAELAVNNQIDVLRMLLQMDTSVNDLKTVDLPPRNALVPDENDALKKALNRPDIKEQKRNLEYYELQTKNLGQKIRPDLTMTASAQLTGFDSAYQRTVDKVLTVDYPVWSVGLKFEYPLGNTAAENDYRKSRLKTEQTSLQVRNLEDGSAKEVRAAIRTLTVGYKQIEVADRGRAFAEERLRAFMRKNEVGLATTKDVLDVENDLAVAKSNQIKAVVEYANAMTTYWQVTGDLLDQAGVRVVESDADKLYSATR